MMPIPATDPGKQRQEKNTMSQHHAFNQELLSFLTAARSPFHAVRELEELLIAAGYSAIDERDTWSLGPGSKFFVTRNDSAIIAGRIGTRDPAQHGMRMAGAHTDSPCLRVKPTPLTTTAQCVTVGVEVYGGVLLNPWFDRDLSLCGRVHYRDPAGSDGTPALRQTLVDFDRAIGVVPSLAIHLDREANTKRSINSQTDLPVLLQTGGEDLDWHDILRPEVTRRTQIANPDILDFELSFYDSQPAALVGLEKEFVASARLDNLLSCFISVKALIDGDGDDTALVVCNDHEEVGSASNAGADGRFLEATLARLIPDAEDRNRALAASLMVSADNAHAVHPNFASRHEPEHGPKLNAGPVLKINANQRYASNSETQALFRMFCAAAEVPMQSFVTRTDLACGSTIGPITAANLGIRTVDVGVPQLAMHSIREMCGASDPHRLYLALQQLFAWDDLG